jgi:hypothetical protein
MRRKLGLLLLEEEADQELVNSLLQLMADTGAVLQLHPAACGRGACWWPTCMLGSCTASCKDSWEWSAFVLRLGHLGKHTVAVTRRC